MGLSAGARILVIEDDPAITDFLAQSLVSAGHEVIGAHDGVEGLKALEREMPDAVVLDLNLPKLDGFGVLKAMRETYGEAAPPVLVLTARNAPSDVSHCIALGAKDYLAKPFKGVQLLARVARLLLKSPSLAVRPRSAAGA